MGLWLLLIGTSLWWNLHQAATMRTDVAFESARALYQNIVLTRHWNATHGKVYVPVSDHTLPNPYLADIPERDVHIDADTQLTMINPAYMTRQLSELAQLDTGVNFHITSLNPLRPENAPDSWEIEALQRFENGMNEVGEFFARDDGQTRFRYMAPLITEQACLACHGQQGYQQGDIRGGISVTLPHVTPIPLIGLISSHLAIAAAGSVLVISLGRMFHRSHEVLRHQAIVDSLTNIPNRRFFNAQIIEEYRRTLREQQPLSLAIIDIDHFKQFNDHFGHQAGDHCLVKIAQLLSQLTRRGGDFCARYGGEEFVIVLPNTTLQGAVLIAEKIRQAVEQAEIHHPDSDTGVITISIGVATRHTDITDEDDLLRQADKALYRAKAAGRNRVEIY